MGKINKHREIKTLEVQGTHTRPKIHPHKLLVFTCMPSGVTVDDSGLCCCVPCLSSAIISLCLSKDW